MNYFPAGQEKGLVKWRVCPNPPAASNKSTRPFSLGDSLGADFYAWSVEICFNFFKAPFCQAFSPGLPPRLQNPPSRLRRLPLKPAGLNCPFPPRTGAALWPARRSVPTEVKVACLMPSGAVCRRPGLNRRLCLSLAVCRLQPLMSQSYLKMVAGE